MFGITARRGGGHLIRVAKPASTGWNLAKTAVQVVTIWSLALYVIPHILVRMERAIGAPRFESWGYVGWAGFAAASVLGLWAGWSMTWHGEGTPLPLDAARKFVPYGPYAWIRNPMAVAGLAQGAFAGSILGSYAVLLYTLAGGLFWNFAVRPIEEADLEERFGAEYVRYRREVKCWRPRLRAWLS